MEVTDSVGESVDEEIGKERVMAVNAPIVVAVDGSDTALEALRWGALAAVRENRSLRVVGVVETVAAGYAPGVLMTPAVAEALHADARRAVDEAIAAATKVSADVDAEGEVREGRPALVLREISSGAHLLVVGRRGRGGVAGLLLGSVSSDVAAHADCPVVVVSGPVPQTGPVVVGVDGSAISQAALGAAFTQAAELGTSLVVVSTYPGFSGEGFYDQDEVLAQFRDGTTESVERQVAKHRRDHPAADTVSVETAVVAGDPAPRIIEAAGDAQLIVLGSRGRGGFRGLLLGSTSQAVLHTASCPVMIVHSERSR
ncbi:MAG TPA: universal stress protein [Gordonia polyisoprenivorans]|uniref:universal stress protein n=1 Tax=Gordonia polyisoprenivorans TaxID=84595 RepID=UPI00037C4F85|nr:universal stress protein [Gordonia polyisoprenivorans]OZC31828.1 universal stress protein [Gordonia polyisoprenivorans]HCS56746.1 universal stress protein [Gordonia polyisoprenivorans]